MTIPKIIHQLWKDETPPARYRTLIESWKTHHPDWDYRLWTDDALRHFVATSFPSFLPIYDSYAENICRADAARYLLLKQFGGLYVDLDAECLRPFDDLITDKNFLIGLEPQAHLEDIWGTKLGLDHLLCPTVIASEQGHPFWDAVLHGLRQRPQSQNVLDITGPAFLTRTHMAYRADAPLTILPSNIFYPLTKQDIWSGAAFDIETWEGKTKNAYALHYWDGTWFRETNDDLPALPNSFPIMTGEGRPGDRPRHNDGPPLVTCMMVTRDRFHLAQHALAAFLNQTYTNSELVIIDDGTCPKLGLEIARLNNPRLRFIRPPANVTSLGHLRNFAVAEARGAYVCQWDDDDLSDPRRIEIQLSALLATGARASFLTRWLIWQPLQQRLMVSGRRVWEGSMLCEKEIMPRYDDLARHEDTPVADMICDRYKTTYLDIPRLYVYVGHGTNTWGHDHFNELWKGEGHQFTETRYDALLHELDKRIGLRAYEKSLRDNARKAAALSTLPGLNIFGMFSSGTGLGSGARGLLAATRNLELTKIDLQKLKSESPIDWAKTAPHRVNLIYTNPDLLSLFLKRADGSIDTGLFKDRYNIGYWAFEGEAMPPSWQEWLSHFDEIWTPSRFVAHCLATHVHVPIVDMPLLDQPTQPTLGRGELELPEKPFLFLTMFDELSGFTRKNPLGTIEAYLRAFPNDDGKTGLIIKARSLSDERRQAIHATIGTRRSIHLRIGEVTQEETASLIAACDAYISLHRAEGFGLIIAEAMQQAKPVIATGWSGNLEFMSPDTSYLVSYELETLTNLTDNTYEAGTEWATPNIGHAARLMCSLVQDPDAASATGARAKAHITDILNPSKAGARIVKRLEAIEHRTRQNKAPSKQPPVLILTPVKNASRFLPTYFALLDRLAYDKSAISLGFIEGDSTDTTLADIQARLPSLRQSYARVTLLKQDEGLSLNGPRWAVNAQRERRATLARARNRLLAAALHDETWVLWLDVDLVDYPPDLLARLIAQDKDIIVPLCILPNGQDYDLNSFRFDPKNGRAEHPDHLIDGIYQPPRGVGRSYLSEFGFAKDPIAIDGVGGTALLIKADLHREGLNFPAFSHRGYIETEGLAMMARDMGHQCWALPSLQIIHTDK